jgi:hypothetical protein
VSRQRLADRMRARPLREKFARDGLQRCRRSRSPPASPTLQRGPNTVRTPLCPSESSRGSADHQNPRCEVVTFAVGLRLFAGSSRLEIDRNRLGVARKGPRRGRRAPVGPGPRLFEEKGLAEVARAIASEDPGWLGTFFEAARLARFDPAFRARWEQRRNALDTAIIEGVRRDRRAGTLRGDVPAWALARFVGLPGRRLPPGSEDRAPARPRTCPAARRGGARPPVLRVGSRLLASPEHARDDRRRLRDQAPTARVLTGVAGGVGELASARPGSPTTAHTCRSGPWQSVARGYKTGTSARARAGTRVHCWSGVATSFPAETCPRVPASGRASPTCLFLVMKGSPVRVRASALTPLRERLCYLTARVQSPSALGGVVDLVLGAGCHFGQPPRVRGVS